MRMGSAEVFTGVMLPWLSLRRGTLWGNQYHNTVRKIGKYYTCQLFLRYKREERNPKSSEEVRSLPKTSEVCRRRSYRGNAYPQNQRSRRKVLWFIHFTLGFRSLPGSELTYFWKLQDGNNPHLSIRREKLARKREPAWDRSFQPAGLRLTPKAWELAGIKYRNTVSKIDEKQIPYLWLVTLTWSCIHIVCLFISSIYTPEINLSYCQKMWEDLELIGIAIKKPRHWMSYQFHERVTVTILCNHLPLCLKSSKYWPTWDRRGQMNGTAILWRIVLARRMKNCIPQGWIIPQHRTLKSKLPQYSLKKAQ